MAYDPDETIAAIASPPGGAARGIVRVSGPSAVECVKRLVERRPGAGPFDVTATPHVEPCALRLAGFTATLPVELYVWPTERSFTRQPTVEIHTIGAMPLLAAALTSVCAVGARMARPGEFTMRAFLAGRIDLTQAEGVLGVIDAVDRRELDAALRQMAGGLAGPLDRLRHDLLDLLADLEAGLDFADEDIRFIEADELVRRIDSARDQVDALENRLGVRHVAADRLQVVLTGEPNVGKSSLFNALAGRAAAIVSPAAGATRDYVRATVEWDGVAVELLDTAGLNAGELSDIEHDAQRFARHQQAHAQVEAICIDSSRELSDAERSRLELASPADAASSDQDDRMRLVVLTKCDVPRIAMNVRADVETSSTSGQGVEVLRRAITDAAARRATAGDFVPATAARCQDSLRRAAQSLAAARQTVVERAGEELTAAEVRAALDELGQVVGAVYTDDVLDRVFSRFCIGK